MKINRTFKQIIHDFFEDSVFAFAMAYAGSKGDYTTVRVMEEKLH